MDEPILGLWEEGGWAVGLGKEGIGAVVGHCSGMRQASCMIAKRRLMEKSANKCGPKVLETESPAWSKAAVVLGDC